MVSFPPLSKTMKLRLFPCALIAAVLSLVGCVDQDQKFVINPDGSGKFIVNTTIDDAQLAALGNAGSENLGKQIALQLLKGTEGIEAWADLKAEKIAGGKTKVTGVGYFPDINKLKFSAGEMGGGTPSSTIASRKEGNQWIIEFTPPTEAAPESTPAAPKKSADEVRAEVKQVQTQWQATKSIVAPLFDSAKIAVSLEVGGSIQESLGFAKEGENQASLNLTGGKVVAAIDKLINDHQLLEDAVASGDSQRVFRDPKRIMNLVMETMTDGKGMPKVVITPGKPMFDYKKEVEEAKANPSEALKQLQQEAKPGSIIRPPAVQRPAGE